MTDNTEKLIAAYRDETFTPPAHVTAQWHEAIDAAAALERGREKTRAQRWHPASFLAGLAVAATLALGIAIGFFLGNRGVTDDPGITVAVVPVPAETIPIALSRGLQVHFQDSRDRILAIDNATNRGDLVWGIVEDNRLFEATATREDAPRIARVLRAIEPVLLQLAAEDLSDDELAALQAQLAFEMNVVLTKLSRQSSDESQTT